MLPMLVKTRWTWTLLLGLNQISKIFQIHSYSVLWCYRVTKMMSKFSEHFYGFSISEKMCQNYPKMYALFRKKLKRFLFCWIWRKSLEVWLILSHHWERLQNSKFPKFADGKKCFAISRGHFKIKIIFGRIFQLQFFGSFSLTWISPIFCAMQFYFFSIKPLFFKSPWQFSDHTQILVWNLLAKLSIARYIDVIFYRGRFEFDVCHMTILDIRVIKAAICLIDRPGKKS